MTGDEVMEGVLLPLNSDSGSFVYICGAEKGKQKKGFGEGGGTFLKGNRQKWQTGKESTE